MKTVEEWLKSWDRANVDEIDVESHLKILRQIQLDAYKAGMTEAVEILRNGSSYLTPGSIKLHWIQTIESARDKKETI